MNEFGDTGDIESRAINVSSDEDPTAQQSEEFLELANGCLCCSVKDTGAAAIENLMKRKGAFDYILLETTGLADPGPIASIFWQNEEYATNLSAEIKLDGVVCVVDAVFGKQQMDSDASIEGGGESLRQIAGADVILVNKSDLVTPSQLADLETDIHLVNSAASVHRTVRGVIDLANIVGIGAYDTEKSGKSIQTIKNAHEHEHDHAEEHHYHKRGISSVVIPCPPLQASQLSLVDAWIRTLLWDNTIPSTASLPAVDILRCKGMVTVGNDTYVLQGVKSIYELAKLENAGDDFDPQQGKLVFIGKGLDLGLMVDSFNKALGV